MQFGVDLTIERKKKVAKASIRESGVNLTFSDSGFFTFANKITEKTIEKFWASFAQITSNSGNSKVKFAKLKGFSVPGLDDGEEEYILLVSKSQWNNWCDLKIVTDAGVPLFQMDLRKSEAFQLFQPIVTYFR